MGKMGWILKSSNSLFAAKDQNICTKRPRNKKNLPVCPWQLAGSDTKTARSKQNRLKSVWYLRGIGITYLLIREQKTLQLAFASWYLSKSISTHTLYLFGPLSMLMTSNTHCWLFPPSPSINMKKWILYCNRLYT